MISGPPRVKTPKLLPWQSGNPLTSQTRHRRGTTSGTRGLGHRATMEYGPPRRLRMRARHAQPARSDGRGGLAS